MFFWWHVRHIILVKIHPEISVREKDFSKIEEKNSICINVYCYENRLVFPIHISENIWNFNEVVACNWEKKFTLPVYQRVWLIYVSQNKE